MTLLLFLIIKSIDYQRSYLSTANHVVVLYLYIY